MERIQGFQNALPLLTRKQLFGSVVLPQSVRTKILQLFGEELSASAVVARILEDVQNKGDRALIEYEKKLDGVTGSLKVDRQDMQAAESEVSDDLLAALKMAAERIRNFHQESLVNGPRSFRGKSWGQYVRPLERIGIYVPGGSASYPSTVLMTAIPAKVVGVKEVFVATPPSRNGHVPAPTLAAANICGIDAVFKIGGAQAIGAFAYGTETVPKVDKICGPGNIFVVLAKKAVYGHVELDGLQGPSEIVIVADESANPTYCAVDLMAQAEHDPLASVVFITTSVELADRVTGEINSDLASEKHSSAFESLENGIIAVVDNLDEACRLADAFAPEHLSLMVRNPEAWLEKISNAGCVFLGENSPVTLGDYIAGPSHVLPTGGSARFSSPLGVIDFIKYSNIISMSEADLRKLGPAAITIARAEGLPNHARAVEKRLRGAGAA